MSPLVVHVTSLLAPWVKQNPISWHCDGTEKINTGHTHDNLEGTKCHETD